MTHWEIRNTASEPAHSLFYRFILIKTKGTEIYTTDGFFFSFLYKLKHLQMQKLVHLQEFSTTGFNFFMLVLLKMLSSCERAVVPAGFTKFLLLK